MVEENHGTAWPRSFTIVLYLFFNKKIGSTRWGLSILEASAAGTPTLAYEVPGVEDAIEDGLNGLKIKDGDRVALSEAALSIITNPEKWWSTSLEVAKKYSWDRTVELWEKLISKVVVR